MNILFFEWKNFGTEDVIESLENLGHFVNRISSNLIKSRINSEFDSLFENLLGQTHYDCVFTFNFYPSVSKNCNQFNIKYISFVYDSPLVALYSYTLAFPCNYVFIFDSAEYLKLKNGGIDTVYYMPLAVNTKRLNKMIPDKQLTETFASDISFVGSMYNEDHNLFERLDSLSPFTKGYLDGIMEAQQKVFGYYFIEEVLTEPIIADLMSSLKYVPNEDGVETPAYIYANYFIGRKITSLERTKLLSAVSKQYRTKLYTKNPTSSLKEIINMGPVDYYDIMPYIFKLSEINLNITLRSIQSGIPLRAFDIMGSKGFLLTNFQSDFLQHFVPNEDFVYFESEHDLLNKCRYYLSHTNERLQIIENAYGKIEESHTYETRFEQIFQIVFQD